MKVAILLMVALAAPVASAQVVFNEVLPAPGADWTDNGSFPSSEDEWFELLNAGTTPEDLTGLFVADGTGTPRIGLSGSLAPGEPLLLNGELAVDWETANGYAAVGLSLNNTGDTLTLFRAAGGSTTEVASYTYTTSASDVSEGRLPDGTGSWTAFDALAGGTGPQPTPGGPNGGPAHPKILSFEVDPAFPTSADSVAVRVLAADADGIASALLLWSVDGVVQPQGALQLVSGEATRGTWEVVLPPRSAGEELALAVQVSDGGMLAQTNDTVITVTGADSPIVLNEILADPPPDPEGDANGDGVRGTSDDEFVELYNTGADPVNLEGWTLHDATGMRHEFGTGTVMDPGEFLVVFGGGTPTGILSPVQVASTGGLSLNNTADQVRLVGLDGLTRDVHDYGAEANADQSLIRVPDGGEWTRPFDVGYALPYSPGVSNTGPSALRQESWARIKALYRP
ncbi:lamin tail domain-containing protein [bacterium]|nr:lamin tail domain-containing protein [bacterium]